MKVVGEEGTSIDDFIVYLKSEYMDATYLQQNAFDEIDSLIPLNASVMSFQCCLNCYVARFPFQRKQSALFFQRLTQLARDMNGTHFETEEFNQCVSQWEAMLTEASSHAK